MALLVRDPFGYMTPDLYASLSDRQIIEVYLAPRDKDGNLIEYRKRHPREIDGETGNPNRAAQELPSVEQLAVPQEALLDGVPMSYVLMFWQVWRGRGLSTEETHAKWKEQLEIYNPRGRNGGTKRNSQTGRGPRQHIVGQASVR